MSQSSIRRSLWYVCFADFCGTESVKYSVFVRLWLCCVDVQGSLVFVHV